MNRLKTTDNGGFPFVLDDLRWTDDGIRDTLAGFAGVYGNHFIISGCELVSAGGSLLNYNAGYIYFNGEVLKVDASASPFDISATPYFNVEIDLTYDTAGLKIFENTVSFDTYEIRKGKVVGYSTIPGSFTSFIGMPTLNEGIAALIADEPMVWTKKQSWPVSPTETIVHASLGENSLNAGALNNYVQADIVGVDGESLTYMTSAPIGTWIAVTFVTTGMTTATITVKPPTTVTTDAIYTPGQRQYVYTVGDTAIFVRFALGWRLLEKRTPNEPMHVVGGSGEPAFKTHFSAGVTDSLRYRREGDLVHIEGSFTATGVTAGGVVDLPSDFIPLHSKYVQLYNFTTDTVEGILKVSGTGSVEFSGGTGSTSVYIIMGVLRYQAT